MRAPTIAPFAYRVVRRADVSELIACLPAGVVSRRPPARRASRRSALLQARVSSSRSSLGDMTRLSFISVVLTVLSVAAQLVALSAVRTWGSRARRGLAFSLRVAWHRIEVAMGVRRSVLIRVPSITSTINLSDGVSAYVIPNHLAEELASYMAHLDGRLAGLADATQAQGERLASLEPRSTDWRGAGLERGSVGMPF